MHSSLHFGCQAGGADRLTLHEVSLLDTAPFAAPSWHFVPGFYEPSRWDEDRRFVVRHRVRSICG